MGYNLVLAISARELATASLEFLDARKRSELFTRACTGGRYATHLGKTISDKTYLQDMESSDYAGLQNLTDTDDREECLMTYADIDNGNAPLVREHPLLYSKPSRLETAFSFVITVSSIQSMATRMIVPISCTMAAVQSSREPKSRVEVHPGVSAALK